MEKNYQWSAIDIKELDTSSTLYHQLTQLVHDNSDSTELEHSLAWLNILAQEDNKLVKLFICQDQQQVIGYAPFLVHPSSLSVEFIGRKLLQISTSRYSLTRGPILKKNLTNPQEIIVDLVNSVLATLSKNELLFFLGLELDSPIGQYLMQQQAKHDFIKMPHGRPYQRRLIEFKLDYDQYMSELKKKNRQELARQSRKLDKAAQDSCHCQVYTQTADVAEFVKHAESISQHTYQTKLLGLGIKNSASLQQRLSKASEQQLFRGYILFVDQQPTAFMLGYLLDGYYYSLDIGYDPKWFKYSVGNVLHLHVVKDLTEMNPKVKYFDFMYGDNENKARLSNTARTELNLYISPKNSFWFVRINSFKAINLLIDKAASVMERYHLKSKIKRFLKRKSA